MALRMILFVTMLYAVELTICIGIGDCGWPNLCNLCCTRAATFALMYSTPNSASTADDISALVICAVLWIALFWGGKVVVFDKKKSPHLCFMIVVHWGKFALSVPISC